MEETSWLVFLFTHGPFLGDNHSPCPEARASPALSHWPQDIGHGQMLDSAWSTRLLLAKSLNLGSKTLLRYEVIEFSTEEWLLPFHAFTSADSQSGKRTAAVAVLPVGAADAASGPVSDGEWRVSSPHEFWVNTLLWVSGDSLCLPQVPLLTRATLPLKTKVFLIKISVLTKIVTASFLRTWKEGSWNSAYGLVHWRVFVNGRNQPVLGPGHRQTAKAMVWLHSQCPWGWSPQINWAFYEALLFHFRIAFQICDKFSNPTQVSLLIVYLGCSNYDKWNVFS